MNQQEEVPREGLDLNDDPELLSPPIIVEPLYQCAQSVTVIGFVPHAEIELEVIGVETVIKQAGYPMPNGESIKLNAPLQENQQVQARQRTSSAQSLWCSPVSVGDHTKDYPNGPPRPQITPAPVYQCGSRTGVDNLFIGGNVWITSDEIEVGRVDGCEVPQGVNINPDYELDKKVLAWFELCGDPSPPSEEHITQPPPSPLPMLDFEIAYESGEQIVITNVVNGARVTLYRNGINQGTSRCWGYKLLWTQNPPFSFGELFEAEQTMCPDQPASPRGETHVEPCSRLPAPRVGPVQVGDDRITLIEFVPDAVIKVYINYDQVANGGGPIVQLTTTIKYGDTIHVSQTLGDCEGQTVQEIRPHCVAPPVDKDPSALDLYPVGYFEYSKDDAKGSVYYPAAEDGEEQPFNERLATSGRVPIVFMAHGNHGTYYDPNDRNNEWGPSCEFGESPPAGWLPIPNHQGYDYFQKQLARMGIIATSVDCNATNCGGGDASNIEQRADLIISSIAYFQELDADPSSIFHQKIDFESVGLMGHSRGGDAVVLTPEKISLPGVTIKGVIALAPTSFGPSSGQPKDYAFMTVLPAGDGDVWRNNGARFYDKAIPEPFKAQLYVHYTNHNFFNRQWPRDEGHGPPIISRYGHERILSVYGCAFLRAILLGHEDTIRFLSGYAIPAGVTADNVYLSFEWKDASTIDNHEDNNGIDLNSLEKPTTQSLGLSADEYAFAQGAGAYNASFFGNNVGMVTTHEGSNGRFRSELETLIDITDREVWIRTAEVYEEPAVPAGATGFELGLEDDEGTTAWVDSDGVGGLPRPYDRRADDLADIGLDGTKTMLRTLRFPGGCFISANPELKSSNVRAVVIRCNRNDGRALAFDDLQIVARPS